MHLASRMNDPRVIKQYHQLSFTSSSDSGIDFHVLTIVPSSIPLYILCIVDQNATSSWKGYFFIWEQRENKEGQIGAHEVGVSSIRCLNCDFPLFRKRDLHVYSLISPRCLCTFRFCRERALFNKSIFELTKTTCWISHSHFHFWVEWIYCRRLG